MEIIVIKESIIQVDVEVIVNPANAQLLKGGGLSGVIHKAAGHELLEYLTHWKQENKTPFLDVGELVLSPSFNLTTKKIIHTVGPIWNNGTKGEKEVLYKCYQNCLQLAEENQLRSIAFPNISTGIYGFPPSLAAPIAISAVKSFAAQAIKKVVFTCFDEENYTIYRTLLS